METLSHDTPPMPLNIFGDLVLQIGQDPPNGNALAPAAFDGVKFTAADGSWAFYPSDFADSERLTPNPIDHTGPIDWTQRMMESTGHPEGAAGFARLITAPAAGAARAPAAYAGWKQYWARVAVDRDTGGVLIDPRSRFEPADNDALGGVHFPLSVPYVGDDARNDDFARFFDVVRRYGCIGAPDIDFDRRMEQHIGDVSPAGLSKRRMGCGPLRASQAKGTGGEYVFAHQTPSGVRTVPLPRYRLQALLEQRADDGAKAREALPRRAGRRGRPRGAGNIVTPTSIHDRLRAAYGPMLPDNAYALQMHAAQWRKPRTVSHSLLVVDWRVAPQALKAYLTNPTRDGQRFMPLLPTPGLIGLPPGAASFVNPTTILLRRLFPSPTPKKCYVIMHMATNVDRAAADVTFTKAVLRFMVPEQVFIQKFDRMLSVPTPAPALHVDPVVQAHPLEALVLEALPHAMMAHALPPELAYRQPHPDEISHIQPGDTVNCVYEKLYAGAARPPSEAVHLPEEADIF